MEDINTARDRADRGAVAFLRMARRSVLAMVLLALTLASGADARQATPVATPAAIDPGDCTVAPRPTDQMRQLIESGLPPIVAFIAGTPTGRGDATPQAASADEAPADETTVAAVTEPVHQFVACSNSGNLAAVAAILTEQGAGSYLSFAFLSFRAAFAGATGTPTAAIDPNALNLFLGAIQLEAPIPPTLQSTLYGIESVTRLEDGRVRVIALMATGTEEPRQTSILLREEDGHFRIIFGRETGSEAASAPEP